MKQREDILTNKLINKCLTLLKTLFFIRKYLFLQNKNTQLFNWIINSNYSGIWFAL